jgi:integrase
MANPTTDPWDDEGRLTQALVSRLLGTPPSKGNRRRPHRGGGMGGMEIVCTSSGAAAYCYRYRNSNGRERYITIGDARAWKLADAEKEYRRLRQLVETGGDPAGERQANREAPTIGELAERFKAEHLPRLRQTTRKDYAYYLDSLILPQLKRIKVAALKHSDVARLHNKIAERGPILANRAVAALGKMLALAVKWELRPDNPARGVERRPEHQRRRYLSPQEIARLLVALDQANEQVSADAVRLLLYTGSRRAETLSATWDQIDFEQALWIKPHTHTKQKQEHRVPLNAPALALLQRMRAAAPPDAKYLFPNGRKGHLVDIATLWRNVCWKAEIDDCHLHDLRHTFASVMVSSGLGLQVVGDLLGHVRVTTTQRYAHLADCAVRQATERAGAIISGAAQ